MIGWDLLMGSALLDISVLLQVVGEVSMCSTRLQNHKVKGCTMMPTQVGVNQKLPLHAHTYCSPACS